MPSSLLHYLPLSPPFFAILAGLFAGLQRIIQGAFVSVTGNESDAAWAITALVLAAAFNPLKGWLERFVARRFASAQAESITGASADGPQAPSAAKDGGIMETAGAIDPTLEALVRRVVREELAAALAVTTGGERGTRADPSS